MNPKCVFLMIYGCELIVALRYKLEDLSSEPTVFESNSLPVDKDGNFVSRQMASVGNGHIATTIYTDTVYLNGLYNGYRGESHRARIPSGNNIRFRINSSQGHTEIIHKYALDVGKGVFVERVLLSNGAKLEQRTFAHRFYTRLIVTQIKVSNAQDPLVVELASNPGNRSEDLTHPKRGKFYGGLLGSTYSCSKTLIKEDPRTQPNFLKICTISVKVPDSITFPAHSTTTRTFITAYGFSLKDIRGDYLAVIRKISKGSHDEILESHVSAWERIWESGSIQIQGNTALSKVVYGSLYYILSSLPVTSKTFTENEQFYGLSPGGLAYGLLDDYEGHSFWDTETWMFPPILYLYPDKARELLNYRLSLISEARWNANNTGYKGARFPWESARTGVEVTQNGYEEVSALEVHVTSDISFAIRQYIGMTRDFSWLTDRQKSYLTNGCALVRDMAEFWTSRSLYNKTTGYYDIKGVMPPDEDNYDVDNNGFTNVGAGQSIFYAKYAECLCNPKGAEKGMSKHIPDEWIKVAKGLKFLYDEEHDYHPEYEGYQIGTRIKQADVVLMGFPQLWKMNKSTRRNDLLIYANVTRSSGPAMTWSMHTVGFLELGMVNKAEEAFNRSYQLNVREPFKIWTESPPPYLGAVNFQTGMGGFLQAIFSGYGGIRVYPEKILILKPRVPPGSSGMIFSGVKYLGNDIVININNTAITLTLRKSSEKYPLVVKPNKESSVDFDKTLIFPTQDPDFLLEIRTKVPTNCDLPSDQIGVTQETMGMDSDFEDDYLKSI